MDEKINVDYIGVAFLTDDEVLEYRRLNIPKLFDEEMQSLEMMCENDNRNVMDLQDHFQRFMPKSGSPDHYDYCSPHGYSSAYIGGPTYPKIYSFERYQTILKNTENGTISEFLSERSLNDISRLNLEQTRLLNAEILQAKARENKLLKKQFIQEATKYMRAYRYYTFLNITIRCNDRIKMYSTENIGRTTFKYPISNNILFVMKSNFGFGNSSYHFINLTYKGIDILPYAALVHYYYVNTIDFFRYTRQYIPTYKNWEVALNFVVETANLAIQDETEFVTKWIANEIDEMVAGLKIISSTPQKSLKDLLRKPNKDYNFLFVRQAYKSEVNEFLAYPEETATIFKAEKLTAALELIDKLKALSKAYPKALDAIEQIKALNIDFFPQLNRYINTIEQEIKHAEEIQKSKVAERDNIKTTWKSYYDKMDEIIEEARKNGNCEFQPIREEFFSINPDFKIIYNDVEKRTQSIESDESIIFKRKKFVEQLQNCKNLILNHLGIVA